MRVQYPLVKDPSTQGQLQASVGRRPPVRRVRGNASEPGGVGHRRQGPGGTLVVCALLRA